MKSSPPATIIAAGELLWDILPSGPRLGGATTNFAALSGRLGESVTLISRVGGKDRAPDPLGREALQLLTLLSHETAGRLNLSGVSIAPGLPTGTVHIHLDREGHPCYGIPSPVAWDFITASHDLLLQAQSATVFYFGTLAQRHETSRQALRSLLQAAPPTCLRVCDLNLRHPLPSAEIVHWSLTHANLIKISDEEIPQLAAILNEPDKPFAINNQDPSNIAAALFDLAPNCRLVAITLGANGSLLADRTRTVLHPGIPVQVVDTIGAGDAFTAGLVHAFLRGATLEQMSQVANLCGSFVASQPGATPPLSPELLQTIQFLIAA